MVKLFYISIYALMGLFLAQVVPHEGLVIEQWVAFGLWVIFMMFVAAVAIIAFKSVWLRDGFAGINKILEDHEAIKFLASVLSFLFFEVLVGLIATTFSGKYPHPSYLYYLAFSGCVGTGGYAIAEKIMKKNKVEDSNA